MAYEKLGLGIHAGYAGVDLRGKLHLFAKQDTDGRFILAGAGETAFGVIYEEADTNGPVSVQYSDIVKVKCGGVIAAGADVGVGANGVAVAYSSGTKMGKALEAGVLDQIIPMMIDRS